MALGSNIVFSYLQFTITADEVTEWSDNIIMFEVYTDVTYLSDVVSYFAWLSLQYKNYNTDLYDHVTWMILYFITQQSGKVYPMLV